MGNQVQPSLSQQIAFERKALIRNERALMREMLNMERNLNRTGNDLRRAVEKGEDMALLRMMGRDYAHSQICIRNIKMMCSHLKRTRIKLDMVKTLNSLYSSVMGVVSVMSRMNQTMNLPVMNEIISEYTTQTHMMNLSMDAVDEMMATDDGASVDEIGDEVVNKILDEFGVKVTEKMESAPQGLINNFDNTIGDLESRLKRLHQ